MTMMMATRCSEFWLMIMIVFAFAYSRAQVRRCVGLRELTFHETLKNFGYADNHCINLGGRLVKVDNAKITEAITGAIQRNVYYYTGAKRNKNKRRFFWRDLSEVPFSDETAYSNWASGRPIGEEEHCVLVKNSEGWTDHPCNNVQRSFICQKEIGITAILAPPDRITVTDTGKYRATCSATTATDCETPTVTWYRDGISLSESTTGKVYQSRASGSAVLLLQNINIAYSGEYSCRANADGKQSNQVSVTIIVKGTPTISSLTAVPCTSNLMVSWKAHPLAKGFPHKLNVYPSAKPSASQTKLFHKDESYEIRDLLSFTKYKVEIIACITNENCPTEYMAKRSVTTRGLPNSATGINLEHQSGECRLTWRQPDIVGDPISGYEVTLTERIVSLRVDVNDKVFVTNTTNTSYIFVPLPNRVYSATVRSLTCAGASKPVNASGACMRAPEVPTKLKSPIVSVSSIENGRISVKAPNETNGLISCLFVVISNGTHMRNKTGNESEYTYRNLVMANMEGQQEDFHIASAMLASSFAFKNEIVVVLGDNSITSCNLYDTSHAINVTGYCRGNGTILALNKPLKLDSSYEAFVIAVVPDGINLRFGESAVTQFSTYRSVPEEQVTTQPTYQSHITQQTSSTSSSLFDFQFDLMNFLIGSGGALMVGFFLGMLTWKLCQDCMSRNGSPPKPDDMPVGQDRNSHENIPAPENCAENLNCHQNISACVPEKRNCYENLSADTPANYSGNRDCYENLSRRAPGNYPEHRNCYENLSARVTENSSENPYLVAGASGDVYTEMRSSRAPSPSGLKYEMSVC